MMNWNGPLTAKQFVILLWGPVLVLAVAGGLYHRSGAAPSDAAPANMAEASNMADMHDHAAMKPAGAIATPPPRPPADPEQIKRDEEERHRNIEAVKNQMERMHP